MGLLWPLRTYLEVGRTGFGSGETSREAMAKIQAGQDECSDQGDHAGGGEVGRMLDMYLKIELPGFGDELGVGSWTDHTFRLVQDSS